MASVSSLGLHTPAALSHAIAEELLPENPPSSIYSWSVVLDSTPRSNIHQPTSTPLSLTPNSQIVTAADPPVEDELLVTSNTVIWSRGTLFRKTFSFAIEKEEIRQALVTNFPTTSSTAFSPPLPSTSSSPRPAISSSSSKTARNAPVLAKALVVFLKTQAHIHFLSGASHIVHMPFEVSSAVALPVGLLIQRVQPNLTTMRFQSSTPSFNPGNLFPTPINDSLPTFVLDTPTKPATLPLRLGNSIGMTQPLVTPESHWPRLVTLLDPLLELGLAIVLAPEPVVADKHKTTPRPTFLEAGEEIVAIQDLSHEISGCEPLLLAITVNRELNTYTVWRVRYLAPVDPFISLIKVPATKVDRRRSSMAPGYSAVVAPTVPEAKTPARGSFRESFGVPLPGKRITRKIAERGREKEREKASEFVASLSLEQDRDSVMTRRQSKRLSSLARVDMPISQERAVFAGEKRLETSFYGGHGHGHGHGHGRLSGFGVSFTSLHETGMDSLLEDIRSSTDFETSFINNGLGIPDHDFDGLAQELSFSKIKTISIGSSMNLITQNPKPRVFTLVQPASLSGISVGIQIGIQDSSSKQLDLITLHMHRHQKGSGVPDMLTLNTVETRRAGGVVDSCKLVDGNYKMMFILSERHIGGLELSIQSSWSKPTTFSVPVLLRDFKTSLQYTGRDTDRDELGHLRTQPKVLEPLVIDNVTGFRPRDNHGLVDIMAKDGLVHTFCIQLEPRSRIVQKILDMCRVVIPRGEGESVTVGWWMVMQWLETEGVSCVDSEWEGCAVLFLAMFMALNDQTMEIEHVMPPRSRWDELKDHAAPSAQAVPSWMLSEAWSWALDTIAPVNSTSITSNFLSRYVMLACRFLKSHTGTIALGSNGFIPTAPPHSLERRMSAARGMLVGFHLILEEFKLDISVPETSRAGCRVVCAQLARWMDWKDLAAEYEQGIQEQPDYKFDNYVDLPMKIPCPDNLCILTWISSRLGGDRYASFPSLLQILESTSPGQVPSASLIAFANSLTPRTVQFRTFFNLVRPGISSAATVEAMYAAGFTTSASLETLPEPVVIPLRDVISMCQAFPPGHWSKELLDLVGRSDIGMVLEQDKKRRVKARRRLVDPSAHVATWDMQLLCKNTLDSPGQTTEDADATATDQQALIRSLFRVDRRLNDAHDLLSTIRPRTVTLRPDPNWSESQYLEKQKDLVSCIALGTFAVPAGRGLLYYGMRFPLPTQRMPISGFNLNCIVKPTGTTVGVDRNQFTEEKTCWSWFHQGVAAGLAISPQAQGIDSSWILFNKPPSNDLSNRHAGFLLALGLNGHLTSVAKSISFRYLTPKHNMTSIGLLLGLAASYRGTMDSLITRIVSVHVTRMLPRGAAELNLSPSTQTAGLMGIGLLYTSTQHRRMSEIMLSELLYTATDVPDETDCDLLRTEGYRLAAGFALGFINLAKGADLKGLHDMDVTNRLMTTAIGTKRADIVDALDRSAAGAVIALALIHLKSNDTIVARKIDVPDSVVQFDYVRPDLLLLRTVAKNLILWDQVGVSVEWVRDNLPTAYRARADLSTTTKLTSSDLAFWSILGGLCYSLGLRWAGSGNTEVRDTLLHFGDHFMRLLGVRPVHGVAAYDEELARQTLRSVLDNTIVATSMVMAGSGDIPVLRRLRALHGRTNPDVPYGSHMAAHMAVGVLFLGCGLKTLCTSDLGIAGLLIGFYPGWPSTIMDCSGHLQAFRHLWVLAAEDRCIVVRDIASNEIVTVPISISVKPGGKNPSVKVITKSTPCLLPPLDTISSIRTHGGPLYWDAEVDLTTDSPMASAFHKERTVYLHRRPKSEGPWAACPSVPLDNMSAFNVPLTIPIGHRVDDPGDNPFNWLFRLESLQKLSDAERVSILDLYAPGDGAIGVAGTGPVDSRLEIEDQGWGREDAQGAKVLVQWEQKRGVGDGHGEWWIADDVLGGVRANIDF